MFAITTRNKLRSRRYALHMVRAWLRVRRQLYATPGMLRYTTGIANLTEFYTCTLWETEMEMFAFMSSGAHRDMMWNFNRWSDSFWAMRWDATEDELGNWDVANTHTDGNFSSNANLSPGAAKLPTSKDNYVSRWLAEQGVIPKPDMPEQPSGIPGTTSVLARVPINSPQAWLKLRRILSPWRKENNDLLRFAIVVGLKECFVIAVWEVGAMEESRLLMATLLRYFPKSWTMRFRGHDFEVGHWDKLRLREILLPKDHLTPDVLL